MRQILGKWLKIKPEEFGLFLWSAALLFLIRTSSIIFNNFAETTFLKRFGVEYLPMVYMANAIVTFFIMGALTGVLKRLPSARLLAILLAYCGVSLALLRPVVGLGFELLYPVLFLLKAQYEAILALVFWNLANDLFNTRQSKRIFPLISAGGVLGGIIGSFGTPQLAEAIRLDNLMLVYLVTTVMAAGVVLHMSRIFPTLPFGERRVKKGRKRSGFIKEIKKIVPLWKESTLIKVLVALTFLPNVLIPIMNFQFNFAVNMSFQTEGGLIEFFGYFRGFLNIISFLILLFVGKIYTRWGLPVALMFHPANYVLAFLAFLLRFDLFSAMYARISTNVLRVTINNPARDILMGLFPLEYRSLVRPFLRGTVVRVGILLGSGFIIFFEGLWHPRYLAVVGMVFAGMWVFSSLVLKRRYSQILLDLISTKVVDLRSLQASDIGKIFSDQRAQAELVQACKTAEGPACIWYAEMMKSQQVADLENHLLEVIQKQKQDSTIVALLPLLPDDAGEQAIKVFEELADAQRPALNSALAQAAARLPRSLNKDFLSRMLAENHPAEVKAQAVIGLYRQDPAKYDAMINSWLDSPEAAQRRAGVIAAGGSGNRQYLPRLTAMLDQESKPAVVHHLLIALHQLRSPKLKELVLARLGSDPSMVPPAVLADYPIENDQDVRAFISLLGSRDSNLRELAGRKLQEAEYHDSHLLIEALNLPNRRLREGVYQLMGNLQISDLEIIDFARQNLEKAYRDLARAHSVSGLPEHHARDLLQRHLGEKKDARLNLVLRVLASQDASDEMRIVLRGLSSADQRLRSNAVEALEAKVGHQLSRVMLPLLEDLSPRECLAEGRKLFDLKERPPGDQGVLGELLESQDWVTQMLALTLIKAYNQTGLDKGVIQGLAGSANLHVARLAQSLAAA